MENGEELYQYPAQRIAFSSDKETFALGFQDGRIEIRNLSGNQLINSIFAHEDSVTAITFLPTGELLSTGLDCGFYAWNPNTGNLNRTFDQYLVESSRTGELNPLRISELFIIQNNEKIVAGQFSYSIGIWNIENGTLINVPETGNYSSDFAFYSNLLADSSSPLSVGVLDETYNYLPLWEGDYFSKAVEFSLDGNMLISGYRNGKLQFLQTESGELIYEVMPNSEEVTGLAFAPNGRFFVSTTIDGIVRVWGIP